MKYNKDNKLRVMTLCSGYDSQCLALERLKRDYLEFDYELVAWSEFDPESTQPLEKQSAVIAHNALFEQWKDRNWGDMTKIDWSKVPPVDLLFYSTPCQSISSAGLQHGFVEGSGTRSSIIWNVRDAVKTLRPKYLCLENVAAMVSNKFVGLFNLWQSELQKLGYVNFAQILNAKSYGVPQNRERIFLVSIRVDENEPEPRYFFPEPFPLKKRLKDVLEKNVDECYYLKDSVILDAFNKRNQVTDGIDVVGNLQPDNMWNDTIRQQNKVLGTNGVSMAITSLHSNHAFKIKEDTEESDGFIDAYPIGRERTDEEKARRSKYGDKGAKFSGGKQLTILKDGVSGCVTTFATKDNLCAELYNETKTEDSE